MNMLILITFILAASVTRAVSFPFADDVPKICVPDSGFIYDHNDCECNSEGTEIVCDRNQYLSVTPSLHRDLLQNLTLGPFGCVPNRVFKLECKKCLCDESGKSATCVRDGCDDDDFGRETPDRCIPGSVFTVDTCNGCICGADGKAACTRLDCNLQRAQRPQCVINSSGIRFECNNCGCSSEGELFCDRMGCTPLEFQHESLLNITTKCEAKSIFDYNCHKCICGDSGNYAMCHGVECSSSTFDKTKDTKDNCSPGMIFGDNCNVCICGSNGKGVCTTMNCEFEYRSNTKIGNVY